MSEPAILFDDAPEGESRKRQAFNDNARPPPAPVKKPAPVLDHERELIKLLETLAYRHDKWRVFADFCEMAACALSNKVDAAQYEKRETRYMQIKSNYTEEEARQFPLAFAHLIEAHEADMSDVLGRVYHALELHNQWAGQYFTPDAICRMTAMMTVGNADDIKERIARRGFITAMEPAVGSGAMMLALARAMYEAGVNYQQHLHVTAQDIDAKCVHMAYIQFTLWHIPAIVVLGDTLALTEREHWYTLAHVAGGWEQKLKTARMLDRMKDLLMAAPKDKADAPIIVPRASEDEEQPESAEPFTPGPQLTLF